jgi:hypothetical protein
MVEEAGGLPVLTAVGDEVREREQEWNLAAFAIEHALPPARPVTVAVTAANGDIDESAAATYELASALGRCGSGDITVVDATDAGDRLGDEVRQALVVVVTGRVRQSELRAAVDRLRSQQFSILGAVLTPGIRSAKGGVPQEVSISSNRRVAG